MRFGIFYEHQLPRPVGRRTPRRSCSPTRSTRSSSPTSVGIDYVWEVEHHFLEEYSHSSAPEVFLAAASQRTKQHPARARHRADPARLQPSRARGRADRDARPDLAAGASSSAPASPARRPSWAASASTARPSATQWEEALDAITRMFVEEPFAGLRRPASSRCRRATSCRSRSRSRTRRCGSRAAAARRSCSPRGKGIGALTFAFIEPEEAKEWVDEYYALIESERVRARPASR